MCIQFAFQDLAELVEKNSLKYMKYIYPIKNFI